MPTTTSNPTLTQALIATENNNTLLEKTLREEKIAPIPSLQQGVTFIPEGPASAPASAAFSKTSAAHQNQRLVATPADSMPKNKRIAALFSGGPAAGGHNVLRGIQKILGSDNTFYGIKNGPKGLLDGTLFEITEETLATVHNLGGFDFLGSDRTKITTPDQFDAVRKTVKQYQLDGIIVIGGDDSNTNAAMLAEYLIEDGCVVVGVPKTIDGDLQVGHELPISFGFDTATKVYAELVGNILQDTPSSRKYWHFIRLMGRSASQVTLEVALQTKPAVTLISEEVATKKQTMDDIVTTIADAVTQRAKAGLKYGVVLLPEGLIEFVPEFKALIQELNDLLASHANDPQAATNKLSSATKPLWNTLPAEFQKTLLLDRDSHGNLQVSLIETEKLLSEMVANKLKGTGTPFKALTHFFGYEGRCGAPSRFDAHFTYNLGIIAGALALQNKTGYLATLTDLSSGGKGLALPLSSLCVVERRHGKEAIVIEKALVQLDSPAFQFFEARRQAWCEEDCFSSPGPRQYWGKTANQLPVSVALNQGYETITFKL